MSSSAIKEVNPRAGVEGGEVILTCSGYDTSDYAACYVSFAGVRGRLVGAAPERVIAAIPEYDKGLSANTLRLGSLSADWATPFTLGEKLADNLHPVANPLQTADLDGETLEQRLARRRARWTPVRSFVVSGA